MFFFTLIGLLSCEDVVPIDLNEGPSKLVVEASIQWEKGTAGNEQVIRLTKTADFYATTIPVVSGAIVFITDSANNQFDFLENIGTGNYICNTFIPVLDENYTLTIVSEGITYNAVEKLIAVPMINNVVQNNNGGFTGEDIEVKYFFQDNGLEDNYYLLDVINAAKNLPEFGVIDDGFFQGNQMFGFYSDSDLKANDNLALSVSGISKNYFNYLNILLGIAGNSGGGPFQTAPASVRGNIQNLNNGADFPFGYFRLSEKSTENYIVQ